MSPLRRIQSGETLARALALLRSWGCSCRVELKTTKPDDLVMDQIYSAVHSMVDKGLLMFPPPQLPTIELGPEEPNRELRIQFHNLPFRVLKVGNKTANGQHIMVEHDFAYHDFQHAKIAKRSERIKNPSDPSTGILLICTYLSFLFIVS
jgi:hypothetical protein